MEQHSAFFMLQSVLSWTDGQTDRRTDIEILIDSPQI